MHRSSAVITLTVVISLPAIGEAALPLRKGNAEQETQVRRVSVPGEIVVCFESDTDQVDLQSAVDGWNLKSAVPSFVVEESKTVLNWRRPGRERFTNVALIRFPPQIGTGPLVGHLAAADGVVWSAPNTTCIGDVKEYIPNDPQYGAQYHLPRMQTDLAWDITLGDPSVIIAVTGDGFDIEHVDLVDNIWTNPGEILNGIDDDGNGYIDDVSGWDFVFNNNNPSPNSSGDDHDTHVGGICCARTDNGVGVAGVAGRATLMPIQFFSSGQPWTAANIAESFAYAVDNGARIISTSYNIDGWVGDPVFTAGLQYLYDQGGLHFNSAGNGSEQNPVRQAFHQTFLVASTDATDTKSSFSNYGTGIDFAAPGSSILSTLLNNNYDTFSGTSMAAPNAAGVAALIWSYNPAWTRAQVVAQMHATADNIDAQNPGFAGLLGGGRVNAFTALSTGSLPPPQVTGAPLATECGDSAFGYTVRFDQIMDPPTVNDPTALSLTYAGPDGVFDTGDDEVVAVTWTEYLLASNEVVVTAPGLSSGWHRWRADAAVLRNPFGTALDGNGDGVPGDSWEDLFEVPQGPAEPLMLPFEEMFAETTIDPNRWLCADVSIDDLGIDEPSAPYAARLNGDPSGGDSMLSLRLDLSGESAVRLTYHYQQTGGGESPDAGDDLFVEYIDDQLQWQLISQHLGADPDMTTFELVDAILPADALHADFRLRFRCDATTGVFDDWFIDDIRVTSAEAPIASSQAVATELGAPIDITLEAEDFQNDALDFVIMTLPEEGTLTDPGAGAINASPYTLVNMGNVVNYVPAPAFSGNDAFTFLANDGTYDSNVGTIDITVGGPVLIWEFLSDDQDPGWSTEGQWAFGQPTGGGSGGGDPTSGFTGLNVYGYNLAGDYPNNLAAQYLTTNAIDCSGLVNTELRFHRWLGVESSTWDHAKIEVSNDGSNWILVWDHTGGTFSDTAWSLQTFDISSVADDQPSVFVRWSMGPTDSSVTYPGWNIDDVQIWGIPPVTLCPEISCPADVSVQCTGDAPEPDPDSVSVSGNCGEVIVVHVGDSSDGQTCPETITRTYRATDDYGNVTDCTQAITVNDDTPPTTICPVDISVMCFEDAPAADPNSVSVSDSCGAAAVMHVDDSSDGQTCPEMVIRTYRGTDDCDNTADCTQTIAIDDDIEPTITCPDDISVPSIEDVPAADPNALSASDSCGAVSVTHIGDSFGGQTCPETITRTYRATDECLNTADCAQAITIDDDTPPTITCPPDKAYVDWMFVPNPNDPSTLPDPNGVDGSGLPTVEDSGDAEAAIAWSDTVDGTCAQVVTRTWTATDACGNSSSCDQIISLVPRGAVTNTERCCFDRDGSDPMQDLRLIFTRDPNEPGCFALNASNPGQYFYTVFDALVEGETSQTYTITLPFPWVTKGAMPIHATDGVSVLIGEGELCNGAEGDDGEDNASCACFEDGTDFFEDPTQVALGSYTDTNGDGDVGVGDTHTFTVSDVDVTFVTSGVVSLTIHLDYGLKGTHEYAQGEPAEGEEFGSAIDCPTESIALIPNDQEYVFSVSGGQTHSTSIVSRNHFKNNPGVAGLAFSASDGDPMPGCTVTLSLDGTPLYEPASTDEDGYYMISHDHAGRPRDYTLTLTDPLGVEHNMEVRLRNRGFAHVDFELAGW